MSEQPARYQRSFPALVGAMIVTLLVVLAFVGWRALFRVEVDNEPVPVDWEESVALAQENGIDVVHPTALPKGWIATSVDLRAGDDPRWAMGVLTDERAFIGIRQEDTSLDRLVEVHVDEGAVEGEVVEIDSDVATRWRTWSDEGGDHAFGAEVGDDVVLVYGSAPVEVIEGYVGLLTLADAG